MRASIWVVLAVLCALVPNAATVRAQGQGGNKALMDAMTEKRRQIRDQVLEGLRREGRAPRDGTVEFTATVKPDPGSPGRAQVRVDSVKVRPAAGSAAPVTENMSLDAAFAPRDLSFMVEYRSLDVPAAPQTVRDTVTVKEGRALPEEPLAAPPPPAGPPGTAPPPAEKGWWDNLLESIGIK